MLRRLGGDCATDAMIGSMSTTESHTTSPILTCGVLEGGIVRLEPLTPEHVPGLQLAAEGAATSPFATVPTPETVEDYVSRSLARRDTGTYAPFAQVEVATDRVVGHTAYLTPRWMPDGHLFAVEVGSSWLSPTARGTAVNPAAKRLLLAQALEDWAWTAWTLRPMHAMRWLAARSWHWGRPSRGSCAPGSPPWLPVRRGARATRPCSPSPRSSGPGSGPVWWSASRGARRRRKDEKE